MKAVASDIGQGAVAPVARGRWHASLRTRLMLWVGALVFLLLLAGGVFALFALRSQVLAEGEARTRFQARQAADRLAAAFASVRVSGDTLVDLLGRPNLRREDAITAIGAVLEANPSAVGGLIAIDPGVLADKRPIGQYVGVASRGVPDRDMHADGYVFAAKDWYRRTRQAPEPWWSEPYFNETAGGRYMTTLNLPLRDAQGRDVGMASLDVPVQALSASLETLRSLPGQRAALFAPAGTIAVHPQQGVAFRQTLAEYIRRYGRDDLLPIEAARAQRQALQLDHVVAAERQARYSVLEPIGDTGWSMQLGISRVAVLADLERMLRLLLLIGALVALLSALAILRLSRRITEPLSELATSAGHFANGEFEWPVPHDARADEVGVMARALERARDSIRQQMAEIERYASEKQRLQSELDIARDIQRSMLPAGCGLVRSGRRFNIQARLEPAKSVGGDFYSHFQHGGDQLWFVVGDVSDKGVPAALFMARAVTVLEVAAAGGGSPAQVLVEAGRHLLEGNETCMFATVLCGSLDLATGELELASAGHDSPLLRRADGRIDEVPLQPGPALGFEALTVQDFAIWRGRLQPGDTLLAYTDGVTEAFDAEQDAFGEQRLREVLRQARGAGNACDGLVEAVHRFAAGEPQSDDITVFGIDCEEAA